MSAEDALLHWRSGVTQPADIGRCDDCGCPIQYCLDACHRACDPHIDLEEGPR